MTTARDDYLRLDQLARSGDVGADTARAALDEIDAWRECWELLRRAGHGSTTDDSPAVRVRQYVHRCLVGAAAEREFQTAARRGDTSSDECPAY